MLGARPIKTVLIKRSRWRSLQLRFPLGTSVQDHEFKEAPLIPFEPKLQPPVMEIDLTSTTRLLFIQASTVIVTKSSEQLNNRITDGSAVRGYQNISGYSIAIPE